jgi:hypothetical protein
MKKDMDKIIFESRLEIESVARALSAVLEGKTYRPSETEKQDVERLMDLLEVMHMEW